MSFFAALFWGDDVKIMHLKGSLASALQAISPS